MKSGSSAWDDKAAGGRSPVGRITSEFRRGRFINSCAMSGVLIGQDAEVFSMVGSQIAELLPPILELCRRSSAPLA